MDLLQIGIGIAVIAWIAFSALIVAFATAAGRADHRSDSLRAARSATPAPHDFPSSQPLRARARLRGSARAATDQRVRASMRTTAIH